MIKSNHKTHQDHINNNDQASDSRSLFIRTVEGILLDEVLYNTEEVFIDYNDFRSLTITHEMVMRTAFSRLDSEADLSLKVLELRKFIRDRLVKQFPCLHSQFTEGFEFDSFENPITTPFDILNINEINLDGEATLHSFIVLNHIFTEMNPTAETELYRILQLASAKLLKDDEFMDECSVSIVRNPSAALKPCFRRYEDKVYRICGF
jgi:hypothetical protein